MRAHAGVDGAELRKDRLVVALTDGGATAVVDLGGVRKSVSIALVPDAADFGALRFCEARVWRFFTRVAPSLKIPIDLVKGIEGQAPPPK